MRNQFVALGNYTGDFVEIIRIMCHEFNYTDKSNRETAASLFSLWMYKQTQPSAVGIKVTVQEGRGQRLLFPGNDGPGMKFQMPRTLRAWIAADAFGRLEFRQCIGSIQNAADFFQQRLD